MTVDFARHRAEIVAQTTLLIGHLDGAESPRRCPGRTIGLHATDTGSDWLLDLTGDVIAWRRSDEPTTAGLRASVTDLLLTIYRRIPVDSGRAEVTGDAELVDFPLERVRFG